MTLRRQLLDRESLRRFAIASGGTLDIDTNPPALAHWAWFPDMVEGADLGPDGHPAPGRVLPATGRARRMFASARIRFLAPLIVDREAEMSERIADQRVRPGKQGAFTLMDVERTIRQNGETCVIENRTFAFLDHGPPLPLPEVIADKYDWCPDAVDLFRFSAATFNAHRIHYDLEYARTVEGYPERVVHGPLTAARLAMLAAKRAPLAGFSFRAQAPLFAGQPVRLEIDKDGRCRAVRCDGVVAMDAQAEWID
ncbi:MaoC family dehydratase N-terminal domain-containing protein [Sphingomonas flavalba]|uniref:FAS1-like dehydratase domain-containing protein n=1 Tax=Sphingomonas flavalba TaxID=2559804 RepID=UPI0039E0C11E